MFLEKSVIIKLKGKAKESYEKLKERNDKEAKSILNSFERVKEILKKDPQYGDPIKKNLIPLTFEREGVKNLYRVELSNYWRMLYTLKGSEVEILLFILSISDHKDYDKLFGYRKR